MKEPLQLFSSPSDLRSLSKTLMGLSVFRCGLYV